MYVYMYMYIYNIFTRSNSTIETLDWSYLVVTLRVILSVTLTPVAVTLTSDIAPVLSKEFLDIQPTTERRFTLIRLCDMIRTHS